MVELTTFPLITKINVELFLFNLTLINEDITKKDTLLHIYIYIYIHIYIYIYMHIFSHIL